MTTIEVVDKVFQIVAFWGQITSLYKWKVPDTLPNNEHPADYTVINTLPLTGDEIRNVVVNVNCHKRDLDQKRGIPDLVGMNTAANHIMGVLDMHVGTGFTINFQQQAVIRQEELREHYINLRFDVNILK